MAETIRNGWSKVRDRKRWADRVHTLPEDHKSAERRRVCGFGQQTGASVQCSIEGFGC